MFSKSIATKVVLLSNCFYSEKPIVALADKTDSLSVHNSLPSAIFGIFAPPRSLQKKTNPPSLVAVLKVFFNTAFIHDGAIVAPKK